MGELVPLSFTDGTLRPKQEERKSPLSHGPTVSLVPCRTLPMCYFTTAHEVNPIIPILQTEKAGTEWTNDFREGE